MFLFPPVILLLWHSKLALLWLPVLYKYHTSGTFPIACVYFVLFVHKPASFVYAFIPPGTLPAGYCSLRSQ